MQSDRYAQSSEVTVARERSEGRQAARVEPSASRDHSSDSSSGDAQLRTAPALLPLGWLLLCGHGSAGAAAVGDAFRLLA